MARCELCCDADGDHSRHDSHRLVLISLQAIIIDEPATIVFVVVVSAQLLLDTKNMKNE